MKMNEKTASRSGRIALALLLAAVFCLFSACTTGSFVKRGFVETSTSHSWKATYSYLDGSISRKMTPEDGESYLHVVLTSEEGSVDLSVTDADGKSLYSGSDLENETFSVGVSGKVTVTVVGHEQKGSFSFSFE